MIGRIGRSRRPGRRSPRTPRGYDPTPPAGGPVLRRALLTPVGAGTPNTPAVNSLTPGPGGPGGTPGGLVTSLAMTSLTRRPGRRAVSNRQVGLVLTGLLAG